MIMMTRIAVVAVAATVLVGANGQQAQGDRDLLSLAPCEFQCPWNSEAVDGCANTISDCECRNGYEMIGYECKEVCDYQYECPEYSTKQWGVYCAKSFDDCECQHGYVKAHGQCIQKCKNDYICPAYSYRKPHRKCYDTFDDCECVSGFVRKDGECWPAPKFECPEYSYPIKISPRDFRDCKCEHGFQAVTLDGFGNKATDGFCTQILKQ